MTIKDIAIKTGVSMATVSRVINNSGYVSPKTRSIVEKVIREYDFVPNAMAKGLSRKNSEMIGALIPEIDNPFFSGVIHGINEICDDRKRNLLLCSTNESMQRELRLIRAMKQQRICGMIVASSLDEEKQDKDYAALFNNFGSPVVLIDRSIIGTDLDGVFTDDARAITSLVALLFDNGHRHIEYFTGQQTSAGKKRLAGFRAAFDRYGLNCRNEWIHFCSFSKREGYQITKAIFSRPREQWPTAIVASNNMLSLGVLRALNELGLQIPQDVAFCAYDQLEIAEYLHYNITLIEKDNAEIGRLAAQILFERIEGTASEKKLNVILQPRLVVRGSEKFPVNRL